jgi:glutathione peroxidase
MKTMRLIISLCAASLCAIAAVVGVSYYSSLKAKSKSFVQQAAAKKSYEGTVYAFELTALDGSVIKLADFEGKVILIVNTAAKCGFASQYKDLEELYQTYKDQGFVVLGVSSDDFGQEIEDHEERVCSIADRVVTTFPIADTVHVTGKNVHPLFKWLNTQKVSVKWNFHKFLIGKDGKVITWFASTTNPMSKKVIKKIEKALVA